MHELQRAEVDASASAGAAERIDGLGEVPPHGHAFLEVALVLRGRALHHSAGGTRPLRRGSVVVVRPGEWHGYSACAQLAVCNLYLFGDGAPGGWAWTAPDPVLRWALSVSWLNPPPPGRPPQLAPRHVDAAARWFDELAVAPTDGPAAKTLRSGLVLCALAALAPAFAQAGTATDQRGPQHPAVLELLRRVQAAPAHPWTLDELAAALHVSPGHLSRLCRTQLGHPPIELVAMLRSEAAAVLLLRGDHGVAEVGRAVGYDDPAYFSRRFRRFHGMSPRRYQQSFATRG